VNTLTSPLNINNEMTISTSTSAQEAYLEFRNNVIAHAEKNKSVGAAIPVARLYQDAAELILQYPEKRADILQAITASIPSVTYTQVKQSVDETIASIESTDNQRDIELAKAVQAEFDISDILPSTVASVIQKDCAQTGARDLATAMLLMTASASLIGSRVEIVSGVQRAPFPANIYYFITGDSSTNKSVACEPVVAAMEELASRSAIEIAQEIEAINKGTLDGPAKKEAITKVQQNRRDYFWEVGSFSPESVSKTVFRQEPRAGFLIHRDEASGLFHYKRWSGGANAMAGSAGDSSTDEFSNLLITGWGKSLKSKSIRVADEKDREARDQTLSISGCLQNKYLSEFLDFAIDNNGWTGRWIFIRASTGDLSKTRTSLERVSPITDFMERRLIPFLSGIRPMTGDGKPGQVILRFDDEAQDFYNDFHTSVTLEVEGLRERGIEPAYSSYLMKGQGRVLKFALLLHLFEALKSARQVEVPATPEHPFVETAYNWEKYVDTPVSFETLKRAVNLEYLVRKEYQSVSEDACTSKFLVEQAAEKQGELDKMRSVLAAIKKVGSIKEKELKTKIRTRSLSSKDITDQVVELAARGCISRQPVAKPGRTNLLTFVKSLRD